MPYALALADGTLETDSRMFLVSFSADGTMLVGVGYDFKARIWNVSSGALVRTIKIEEPYVFGTAISRNAEFLAAGSPDKSIKVFNLNTGNTVLKLTGHTLKPYSYGYKFSPDSKLLATSSAGQVKLWDIASGATRLEIGDGPGIISTFAFSPDAKILAGANEDANVRIWDVRSGQLLHVIDELPVLTTALMFSRNGAYLISAALDRSIRVWGTETWKGVRQFEDKHPEPIWAMDLSPDGRILATGGADAASNDNPANLVLWDMNSGKALKTVRLPHGVLSVAFSPDGRMIAVANLEMNVKLWQVSNLLGR